MSRSHHWNRVWIAGAVWVVMLSGCRGGAGGVGEESGVFGPTRAFDSVLEMEATRGFLSGLLGEGSRERVFEIVDGEDAGGVLRVRVRVEGGRRVLVSSTPEGEDAASTVDRLVVDSAGDLVAERSMNRARDVITDFEPPLLVFPSRLDASAPVVRENVFIIHPFDNPRRVKQRGRARVEISVVGREVVELGDGAVDAVRVRSVLTIDFGPARVERVTDQWFAEGAGVVAEGYDERIRVLGIETEHRYGLMRAATAPVVPSVE